jgi:hypothetical protein
MASRKTEPEPFPVRGTPSGYRDRWEGDDGAVIQAQIAEHERLLVAAREAAAPYRRGKGRAPDTPHQPAAPTDRIASDP